MTKKAKSSKGDYEPVIYCTPHLDIAYGLFANREDFDKALNDVGVPPYLFNTLEAGYAATMRGSCKNNEGRHLRYAFVFAEEMLKDSRTDEPRKLSFIAHEAYHVVVHMMNEMHEKSPSEEFFAYSLTEVTDNLFQEYFRLKEAGRVKNSE